MRPAKDSKDALTNVLEDVRWDQQLDRDSAFGKLDFLFDEAEHEATDGQLVDWPPAT